MRTFLSLLIVLFVFQGQASADKKVVIRNSDGAIVYTSQPEFEEGKGVENAIAICGGSANEFREAVVQDSDFIFTKCSQSPEERIQEQIDELASMIRDAIADGDDAKVAELRAQRNALKAQLEALK